MEKPKRSYYLPKKLIDTLDKECRKTGLIKEKAVAAAIFSFLQCDPSERSDLFEQLDKFLSKK